jgi:hypothetical protein
MTKAEIIELVAVLMAAYPTAQFPDGTVAAYENFLQDLDRDQARQAVANLVRSSRFMPAIADVVAAYEALAPTNDGPRHGRYLGPRYTGEVMAPGELKRAIDAFLSGSKPQEGTS